MENSSMLKGSMVRLMHSPKCNLLTLALSQRVFSQLWKKKNSEIFPEKNNCIRVA